jgi:hypothetical protein
MGNATRMADGDFYAIPDYPPDTPRCHPRCNGTDGFSNPPDPNDRIPVPCPIHRPHLTVRRRTDGRRPRITLAS